MKRLEVPFNNIIKRQAKLLLLSSCVLSVSGIGLIMGFSFEAAGVINQGSIPIEVGLPISIIVALLGTVGIWRFNKNLRE